jgi:hypothetical protein
MEDNRFPTRNHTLAEQRALADRIVRQDLDDVAVGRFLLLFKGVRRRNFAAAGLFLTDFCSKRMGLGVLKRSFCYLGEFVGKKRQSIRLHAAGARCLINESRNLLFSQPVRT